MKITTKRKKRSQRRSGVTTPGPKCYARERDENGQWWIEEHGARWRSLVDWQLWDIIRQLIPAERVPLGIIGIIQVPGIDEPWTVELVDGDEVNLIQGFDGDDRPPMDFTQGANFEEARWVTDKHIWLDDRVRWDQQCFTLYHECGETRYMIRDGVDYDTAHMKVNKEEKELRETYRTLATYQREEQFGPVSDFRKRIKEAHTLSDLSSVSFDLEYSRGVLGQDYEPLKEQLEEKLKSLKHPFGMMKLLALGGLGALVLWWESKFTKALARGLREQVKATEERIEQAGFVDPWSQAANLFDAQSWNDTITTIARDNLKTIIGDGTLSELEDNLHGRIKTIAGLQDVMPGGKLPLTVQHGAKEFLDNTFSQPWWNDYGPEVQKALAQAHHDGIAAGDGPEEMRARIRGVLGDISDVQADRIVRTETTGGFNHGLYLGRQHLKRLGIVTHQRWLAVDNGHNPTTRPAHKKAHGQTVTMDEPFEVGGELARYPGDVRLSPGNRINCRCIAKAVKR